MISELKKQRDGGFEIKFFDRLKALEKLDEIAKYHQNNHSAIDFCNAINNSAAAIWQTENEPTTDVHKGF